MRLEAFALGALQMSYYIIIIIIIIIYMYIISKVKSTLYLIQRTLRDLGTFCNTNHITTDLHSTYSVS